MKVNRLPLGEARRESAHAEVIEAAVSICLGDLELVPQVEGDRRAVEPRPEVGRARRSAYAGQDRQLDASAIASGSGSTTTGTGLSRAAVSESLSPCPVSTQTARVPGPTPVSASAARPAADEGSQRTPSSCARSRHAWTNRVVRERHDVAAGRPHGLVGSLRVSWVGDSDRGRHGRRAFRNLPGQQGRQARTRLCEPSRVRAEGCRLRRREVRGRWARLRGPRRSRTRPSSAPRGDGRSASSRGRGFRDRRELEPRRALRRNCPYLDNPCAERDGLRDLFRRDRAVGPVRPPGDPHATRRRRQRRRCSPSRRRQQSSLPPRAPWTRRPSSRDP